MTSTNRNQYLGPPPPITKLTMEQDLQMRILEDKLNDIYHDRKEEIITLFTALQRQNFVMGNSIKNLVEHWPHEEIVFIHSGERIPNQVQPEKFTR